MLVLLDTLVFLANSTNDLVFMLNDVLLHPLGDELVLSEKQINIFYYTNEFSYQRETMHKITAFVFSEKDEKKMFHHYEEKPNYMCFYQRETIHMLIQWTPLNRITLAQSNLILSDRFS